MCQSVESFNIKLVDFGLSRRLTENRDICVMQGTPDFVSPEVATSDFVKYHKVADHLLKVINFEPIGLGSDIWSVGVVTYVLLSGVIYQTNLLCDSHFLCQGLSPFLGNSNMETYSNITSCNYTLDEEQFDNVRYVASDNISFFITS